MYLKPPKPELGPVGTRRGVRPGLENQKKRQGRERNGLVHACLGGHVAAAVSAGRLGSRQHGGTPWWDSGAGAQSLVLALQSKTGRFFGLSLGTRPPRSFRAGNLVYPQHGPSQTPRLPSITVQPRSPASHGTPFLPCFQALDRTLPGAQPLRLLCGVRRHLGGCRLRSGSWACCWPS